MIKSPLEKVIGTSIYRFIPKDDQAAFRVLQQDLSRGELTLQAEDQGKLPVYISVNSVQISESQEDFCIVVTDLTEQKQKEEIIASEKLARSIIEQATEAVVVCNNKGNIFRFSNAVPRILGCDPSLKRFDDLFNLHTPIGSKLSPVSVALHGETFLQVEAIFDRSDGNLFHLILNTGPLKNVDGKIIGCVITLTDITELKKVEDTLQQANEELEVTTEELRQQNDELMVAQSLLRESEERFRSAFEDSAIAMALTALDGRLLNVNSAFSQLIMFSESELIGHRFLEFTHPDDLEVNRAGMDALVSGASPTFQMEKRYIRKDGQTIWVDMSTASVRNADGKPLHFVTHLQDITKRKDAEEALRKSEEQYRSIVETANEGIWIIDAEARTTYVNEKMADMLGYGPEEIIGRCSFDFMDEESRAASMLRLKERKMGVKSNPEVKYIRKDGMPLWTISNVTPLIDKSGKFAGALDMVSNITERNRMEEDLRKSHEELEQRVQERTTELSEAKENLEVINEELQAEISAHEKIEKDLMESKEAAEAAVKAKAAFLANMSHELRTPMNAVIGFSSLLLDDSLTTEQKEYIEAIRKGGEALLAVIDDILEFSRVEKEKIELERQPFSLKHLIDESLDMVATQANKKGLNLSETIRYGTPDTIIGDHGRLRQILVNLLTNAVKFTDKGDVSVSVSSKAVGGNNQQIFFEVKDTGIGIPKDKISEIFEPFVQVELTLSRKRDGVGLGLAITKQLLDLMGGKIWVESTPGKGTTFSFTIQAETIPGKQLDFGRMDSGIAPERVQGLKPMRILVAEDNPSNQKVLVEMLKRLGYRADAVADGREAVQALERQDYDLVLMDIKMPEMDGITAAKVIRKLRPEKGPKIVAITAFALEGDREKCLDAGMNDYIAKPVQMRELAEVLKKNQPSSVDS
ncbi:Methanogenesis regulatory histidine kinase FilI [uncultured archaeon]|nr:Methanogenesis regulatory histidine kinase FilI [uncultured archaeon]